MPYDKIIDSAKLDGALSATANAIRAKNGDNAKIPWDTSTGFASAISAIESGAKVASGTVTLSSDKNLSTSALTVSGIGFKPSQIFLFGELAGLGLQTYSDELNYLTYLAAGAINYGVYTNATYSEDYDEEEDLYYSIINITAQNAMRNGALVATFTDDGFTITDTKDNSLTNIRVRRGTWNYIAIA